MSLSTTQYGYIIDPMIPFTDDKGKTIKNGFIRVFMAGTSTPVITYRNYDGATNQEKIELDNSGRVKHNVIGSKGSLYKVVVYDAHHSQETPILTVDKIAVLGASINATGATIVTGLDSVTVQEENFLKATVEGTEVELSLDPTEVTDEVSTSSAAVTAAPDYVVPLLDKTGEGDSKKISLANLFKFALDWISRLATTISSFASGDYIAVSNPTDGTRKMSKDKLLELTAQNALAGNVAQEFVPNSTNAVAGMPYVYGGELYVAKENYSGEWNSSKFKAVSVQDIIRLLSLDKAIAETIIADDIYPQFSSSNLLDTDNVTTGYYCNYTSGAILPQASFCITDYLPVSPSTTYYMKNCKGGYQVAFFDTNKNFVGGVLLDQNVSSKAFTTPAEAFFAIYSLSTAYKDTNFVVLDNNVMEKEVYGFAGYGVRFDALEDLTNKVKIEDFNFLEESVGNLFDSSKVVNGYFIRNDGDLQANANYCYCEFDVIPSSAIAFVYCHIITYKDNDGNLVSGSAYEPYTTSRTGFVPAGATKCYVSIPISYKGNTAYVYGGLDRVSPAPPAVTLNKFPKKLSNKIIVDANGNGDFTTLTEAVSFAKNGDIIHVCAGVYDNEEVECWKKTITIEGEGQDCTIIKNGLNTYSRPPLEMASGILKNITIHSYGTSPSLDANGWSAYAIHVEANILANNYLYCENVTFRTAKGEGAVGMGMRGGCRVTFKNCIFIADERYAFYAHDAASSDYAGVQDLLLLNCLFKAGTNSCMRLASEKIIGTTVNLTCVCNAFEDSDETPSVYKYTEGSGTATGNTNMDLINWNKTKMSHGNNIDILNYQ